MPNGRVAGRRPPKRPSRAGSSRSKSGGLSARDDTVLLGMAGTLSNDLMVKSDLRLRPPSGVFNARIPRNIQNQLMFVQCSVQAAVTTSATTFTETNTSFTANPFLTQYSQWLAVFDQYFLAAVTCTIANNSPEGGAGSIPQVFTAIDFDSVGALGSLAAISQYSSCNVCTIGPGNSVTRIIRPCNASYLGASATAGISRTWVDSAINGVPFYGFRSIVNNTPGATVLLDYTYHLVWCLRNTI